jgi:hypothetical protein
MDVSSLSKSNFEVESWVESVLCDRREGGPRAARNWHFHDVKRLLGPIVITTVSCFPPGDALETYISTISMKLQLLSQDLNSELEKGTWRNLEYTSPNGYPRQPGLKSRLIMAALMDIVGTFPKAMSEVDRFETAMKDLTGDAHGSYHAHVIQGMEVVGRWCGLPVRPCVGVVRGRPCGRRPVVV